MAAETNANLKNGYGFGAILPIFEVMTGVEVDISQLPDQVASGVALHEKAEKVYCDIPELEDLYDTLRRQVREKKLVPKKMAGDYARLGTEFLLSGYLLDQESVVDQYRNTMSWVENTLPQITAAASGSPILAGALDGFVYHGIPAYFKSPKGTAVAIGRSMADMYEGFEVPPKEAAAAVLQDHQILVREAAGQLFANVLAGIRAA